MSLIIVQFGLIVYSLIGDLNPFFSTIVGHTMTIFIEAIERKPKSLEYRSFWFVDLDVEKLVNEIVKLDVVAVKGGFIDLVRRKVLSGKIRKKNRAKESKPDSVQSIKECRHIHNNLDHPIFIKQLKKWYIQFLIL